MTQRFDRLPNDAGLFMQVWAENFLGALETALTDLEAVNDEQTSLLTQIQAAQADLAAQLLLIQQAQADADTANASIEVQQAFERTRDSESISPNLIGTDAGTDATVTIDAHTRAYLDEGDVALSAGSVTGLLFSTTYYIFYNDPTFAGGAVTYQADTDNAAAVASLSNPTRHIVGSITTPANGAPDTSGTGGPPPWKL